MGGRLWYSGLPVGGFPPGQRGNSNSATRYAGHQQDARTSWEIRVANDKEHGAKALVWDLRKGFILLLPTPAQMGPGLALGMAVMSNRGSSDVALENAGHSQLVAQLLAELRSQDVKMQVQDPEAAEMARLEALEEFPPNHICPPLLAGFPRGARQTQA